jgi:superfamily II DNA helicase RecQ
MKAFKTTHRNETRICIDFPYNAEIKARLKQIPDIRWSQTLKAWHIPYTNEAIEQLKTMFPDIEYSDGNQKSETSAYVNESILLMPKTIEDSDFQTITTSFKKAQPTTIDNDKTFIQHAISDYEIALIKMILYCLTEIPFSLGIRKIISVLKGTKSTFAINNKLNKLKTFSVLSSFSKDQLTTVIEILIQKGLIKIENISDYNKFPVLKITDKGKNFLDGKENIQVVILDALIDNDIPEFNGLEKNLFIKLRALRRDIAQQNDLPAFTICGDQVLREICFKKPTDAQQLVSIKGIGEKFANKYGDLFLEIINKTCT